MADIGQTLNSSVTYQHLVTDNPDVRFWSSAGQCACYPWTMASIASPEKSVYLILYAGAMQAACFIGDLSYAVKTLQLCTPKGSQQAMIAHGSQ